MHDHHIPLRKADLVRKLGDEPSVTIFEREQFRALCELVEATIHNEYRSRLARLKADYAPFDPDDDAAGHEQLSDVERSNRSRAMFDEFDALLGRANYRRLSRDEIEGRDPLAEQNGIEAAPRPGFVRAAGSLCAGEAATCRGIHGRGESFGTRSKISCPATAGWRLSSASASARH